MAAFSKHNNMTSTWHYGGLLLFVLGSPALFAQAVVKEKSSLIYTVTGVDSLVRAQKNSTFDAQGRLLTTKNYYYNLSSPGILTKEETTNFNSNNQILTETITRYPTGMEPQTERLETKYLDYQPREEDSKRIWRRHYDQFGELTKEDTLTYNPAGLLLNSCQYNYMGSTSLLCDEYSYKDTLRKRWVTYSKWNTINGKSDVVEKQTKRRDYRYCYNKQGNLKRLRAKDYSSKIRRTLCYDKQGQLEEDHLVVRRKITKTIRDEEGNKTKKKKTYVRKTENILQYEEGVLVEERQVIDDKETQKETFVYEKGRLQVEKTFIAEVLTEEVLYTYNDTVLAKKAILKYDPKGNLRYTTQTTYNELGQAERREQIARNSILSITDWTYNEQGDVLSQTAYHPTPTKSKKVMNPINRPKEKIVYIYTYH